MALVYSKYRNVLLVAASSLGLAATWACSSTPEDGTPGTIDAGGDAFVAQRDSSEPIDTDSSVADANEASTEGASDASLDADADAGDPNAIVQIGAGYGHACAMRRNGHVLCWGANFAGQLGDGTTTDRSTPAEVKNLTDAVQLSSGGNHVCALRANGTVVCWGNNAWGQIGDGVLLDPNTGGVNHLLPTAVIGLSNIAQVSAGYTTTCARKSTGGVSCWGFGLAGELGYGTLTQSSTPGDVTGVTNAAEISMGTSISCARKTTGSVVCWGDNAYGELGDGTTDAIHSTPGGANVTGLTDAVQISAGQTAACARHSTGAVSCWGFNSNGQLGDNTTTDRPAPTAVSGLSAATSMTYGSGYYSGCAITTAGGVVCWGANDSGQLGDGTMVERHVPTAVPGLSNVVAIAPGGSLSCALDATGVVSCWGANDSGQLGDGTMVAHLTPSAVKGL